METNDKVNQEDLKKNLPDEDTQKILDEMDADGIKDIAQKPTLPDEDNEKNKDKKEDIKPKSTVEDEDDLDDKGKKKDDLEDDEEDEDKDIPMMPVTKHTSIKKKLDEKIQGLEHDLQIAQQQAGEKDVSKKLESLAEKYNTEPDFVKDLYGLVKSDSAIPQDLQKKIDYIDQRAEHENQTEQFNNDFETNVRVLIKEEYPDATQSQIEGIKQKVHDHAFTEKYQHTPLDLIYRGLSEFREFFEDSKSKKTAESSGKRTKSTKVLDFETMTDAEAAKLSDDDFDKYSEYKEKSGSHLSIKHN